MGKTFAMSGIVDWLRATSLGRASTKKREKDTKKNTQEKTRGLKTTGKETLKETEEPSSSR